MSHLANDGVSHWEPLRQERNQMIWERKREMTDMREKKRAEKVLSHRRETIR